MRRKIVAGNWKMNGDVAFVSSFTDEFLAAYNDAIDALSDSLDVIIAPPSILLSSVVARLEGSEIEVAAQNVSEFQSGAYTGEISSLMVKDIGCGWCLVGHSERRTLYAESDTLVLAKVKSLLAQGLKPILCVGETLEEREGGQAVSVVSAQVNAVYSALAEAELRQVVIAYEPVWAIGTGKTATPEQAQEMHSKIRQKVAEISEALSEQQVILYGGSVNASNAVELFAQSDIDGGLVGGASLKPMDFIEICKSV